MAFWQSPGAWITKKCMLVNKDFQIWHVIVWHHSRQTTERHDKRPLSSNMVFNKDLVIQALDSLC